MSLYTPAGDPAPSRTFLYSISTFIQVLGRVGGAISPWIVKGLRHIYHPLPFLVMGVSTFVSAVSMVTVPEKVAEDSLVDDVDPEKEMVM